MPSLQSVSQFSRSVVSDSLWPHESQHARPPCPSPTPGVHSNSCASSRWCRPAISSSVVPFSYCPQSLPASGSFPMSQLFAWDGQNIGVSALASVLPKNTQGWSPLEWTGWISLQSKYVYLTKISRGKWKSPFPLTSSHLNLIHLYVCICVFSHSVVSNSATPQTVAHQAPLSMEIFRQEYWSGLPFPPPGNLLDPGTEPMSLTSLALAGRFFTTAPPGNRDSLLCIFLKSQLF